MADQTGFPQDSVLGPILFNTFTDDLGEEIKCTLRQFTDDTKSGENVDLLEYRKGLQMVLDRLDLWVTANCRSFNKVKCRVLYFCHNNPIQHCRLLEVLLESCPAEKDLGLRVNSWLSVSQQCFQMAFVPWLVSEIV